MTNETIKTYSYRISQASKTELVVIMYDIATEYLHDAKESYKEEKTEAFRDNLKKTKRVISALETALDMQYDISKELLTLYLYMDRMLMNASIKNEVEQLDVILQMIGKLRKSFEKIAKEDESGPMMKNTQQIYQGLTYSNGGYVNEISRDPVRNRGYRV
jgi:flagellar protein FliS